MVCRFLTDSGEALVNPQITPLFLKETGKYYWNDRTMTQACLFSELKIGKETDIVQAVEFFRDNYCLVARCRDNLKIVDSKTGEIIKNKKLYSDLEPNFSYSSGRCISVFAIQRQNDPYEDLKMAIWDVKTDEFLQEFKDPPGWLYVVCLSPDNENIAMVFFIDDDPLTMHYLLKIWNLKTGSEYDVDLGNIHRLDFSSDGKTLAVAGDDRFLLLDMETKNIIKIQKAQGSVTAISYSPDGKSLAVGEWIGQTKVFDTETWEEKNLNFPATRVVSMEYSPCSRFLAILSRYNLIKVFDTKKQIYIRTFVLDGDIYGFCLSWSSDGEFLASGHSDGTIRMWKI
jgi:WD40 repeat protein